MGIPLYFRKVVSQNQNLIKERAPECGRLFLDFNGIIHGAAARALENNPALCNTDEHEERIIQETISYMRKVLQFAKPKELVYIGMDGVAPLAKIQQQRSRRHMSHFIKSNQTNPPPKIEWDTNAISPGTHFMSKCSDALRRDLRDYPLRCIVSDSLEEGEGEHKIFNYIEREPSARGVDVIYGLDADLIMLGLISRQERIFLLREPVHFKEHERSKPFLYFDVGTFRGLLMARFQETVDIRSYVFLCFFIGNDFLPPLSYLNIRNNHIDTLVEVYRKVLKSHRTVLSPTRSLVFKDGNRFVLDQEILTEIMHVLSENETECYQKVHNAYFSQSTTHLKSKEQRFQNYGIYKKPRLLNDLFESNWIQSYYVHLFDMSTSPDGVINNACEGYLRGLLWTSEYYFNKSNAFAWYYPYAYSPTIIDLHNTIQISFNLFDIQEAPEKLHIEPEMQLLMILPIQSKTLLPKQLQHLMTRKSPIGYMYPKTFQLQTYLKTKLHECIPMLPKLQVKRILEAYERVQ